MQPRLFKCNSQVENMEVINFVAGLRLYEKTPNLGVSTIYIKANTSAAAAQIIKPSKTGDTPLFYLLAWKYGYCK